MLGARKHGDMDPGKTPIHSEDSENTEGVRGISEGSADC